MIHLYFVFIHMYLPFYILRGVFFACCRLSQARLVFFIAFSLDHTSLLVGVLGERYEIHSERTRETDKFCVVFY